MSLRDELIRQGLLKPLEPGSEFTGERSEVPEHYTGPGLNTMVRLDAAGRERVERDRAQIKSRYARRPDVENQERFFPIR